MNTETNNIICKKGDILILTEEKMFSYCYFTKYERFNKYYIHYHCHDCLHDIVTKINRACDINYGDIYNHLKKHHNAICIENTEDIPKENQTKIRYKKAVLI